MWDNLHAAFDRGRGTQGTFGVGGSQGVGVCAKLDIDLWAGLYRDDRRSNKVS